MAMKHRDIVKVVYEVRGDVRQPFRKFNYSASGGNYRNNYSIRLQSS